MLRHPVLSYQVRIHYNVVFIYFFLCSWYKFAHKCHLCKVLIECNINTLKISSASTCTWRVVREVTCGWSCKTEKSSFIKLIFSLQWKISKWYFIVVISLVKYSISPISIKEIKIRNIIELWTFQLLYMMWYAPKKSLLTEAIAEVNNDLFGAYQHHVQQLKSMERY